MSATADDNGGAALQEQIVSGQRRRYRKSPDVAFTGQEELPPRVFEGPEDEGEVDEEEEDS